MKYISDLFSIQYNKNTVDISIFKKFVEIYEKELLDILRQFNVTNINIPIHIMNKKQLDEYVQANSISFKGSEIPSWLVGFSSSKIVCVIEPNTNNFNNIIKVALHESIHYILYTIYPNNSHTKLLDEGLATFFSKQNFSYCLQHIKEDYTNNTLKSISDLCTQDSNNFAKIKGYSYSYYVIDFLIQEFGIIKVLKWYANYDLFNSDIINLNIDEKFSKYITEKISN